MSHCVDDGIYHETLTLAISVVSLSLSHVRKFLTKQSNNQK